MKGKTALVTGASAGIGLATVETLAKNGINVIGCADRNIESLEKLKSTLPKGSGSVFAVECDLSKEENILHLFKTIEDQYKYVDVLVNNAARYDIADVTTADVKLWKAMLDLNILGLSVCVREALRLMDKYGIDDGHIVNINSMVGHSLPKEAVFHFYASTKHMVTALTEALYQEIKAKKGSKIRVTSLSPGVVATPGLLSKNIEVLQSFRNLDSKDVADAVLYVITVPAHVCIKELTIAPTEQPV